MAPVQGEKPERRPGADGRRSHRVVQQSDLAEPLSGAQSGNQAAVADHLGLAVLDHVEAIAVLALVEDLLTRGKLDLVDMQGKFVDRRHREGAEHVDAVENLDLLIAVRDRLVD